ncbi:Replication protein A 70 kDa DNA-binding subunit E [Linum grandiflorum]
MASRYGPVASRSYPPSLPAFLPYHLPSFLLFSLLCHPLKHQHALARADAGNAAGRITSVPPPYVASLPPCQTRSVFRPRDHLDRFRGIFLSPFPFAFPKSNRLFQTRCFGCDLFRFQGIRIQGDTLRNFAALIQKRIVVGSVYKISSFCLRQPRAAYRTCRFPHWLSFTTATKFELQPMFAGPMPDEVLEYVRLAKFPSRLPPSAYLTDFVGKLIVVGHPNYVDQPGGPARTCSEHYCRRCQVTIRLLIRWLLFLPVLTSCMSVFLSTCFSGVEVDVSLWSDLSSVIDADAVVLDDASNPAIVAFAGFRVHLYRGRMTASSTLASRVFPDPTDTTAEELRTNFRLNVRPITYVPPKFASPEKLKDHVQASIRTVEELLAMYVAGGDEGPAYRCDATIVGFDRDKHWCYKACPSCSRTVLPNGYDFWCSDHETVLSADVIHRYRLKLSVQDHTTRTTFVLLGITAEKILPISAADLSRAYPDENGPISPPLQLLIGQQATFEVHLPRNLRLNTFEDIRISKVWGLVIPRAQVLACLPPPPPPRSPSPPARHALPSRLILHTCPQFRPPYLLLSILLLPPAILLFLLLPGLLLLLFPSLCRISLVFTSLLFSLSCHLSPSLLCSAPPIGVSKPHGPTSAVQPVHDRAAPPVSASDPVDGLASRTRTPNQPPAHQAPPVPSVHKFAEYTMSVEILNYLANQLHLQQAANIPSMFFYRPPAIGIWKAQGPTTPVQSVLQHTPVMVPVVELDDDAPLSTLIKRRKVHPQQPVLDAPSAICPATPAQITSAHL